MAIKGGGAASQAAPRCFFVPSIAILGDPGNGTQKDHIGHSLKSAPAGSRTHASSPLLLSEAVEQYLVFLKTAGRAPATAESYSASLRLLTDSLAPQFRLKSLPVHHFPVAARKHGILETEFPNAAAHAIHGGIILPRVAGVEHQSVYGQI
jgi:hypothetical protein